jgi:hypothetical protein
MPAAKTLVYCGIDGRGRTISLTEERYLDHILYERAELASCFPSTARCPVCYQECFDFRCIDRAIRQPLCVCHDKTHDDRENFYGPAIIAFPPPNGGPLLKVCVGFRGESGTIITALSVDKVHPKDRLR